MGKVQLTKTGNDKGDIFSNKKLIRWYFEQLYAKQFHSLKEMHNFWGQQFYYLKQEKMENLSIPVSVKENECVIKNLPTKETSISVRFTSEVSQHK